MSWGTVELEREVEAWLGKLTDREFERATFYIDLLEEIGVELREPYARHLHGQLRELRFDLAGRAIRITYHITRGRRIVLLTVFLKRRRREKSEIRRAVRAMTRCMLEDHQAEDE